MTQQLSTEVYEKPIAYNPIGADPGITRTLSLNVLKRFVANKTKKGVEPTDADLMKFMMLCQSGRYDPFARDCWLLGYDSDGGASFSMIVAFSAYLKRAEANDAYRGIEGGIVVKRGDKQVDLRGALKEYDSDILVGAWARVYRSDRDVQADARIKLQAYDQQRSRWKTDPEGMILKCAYSAAIRLAFPKELGGVYTDAEQSAFTVQPPKLESPFSDQQRSLKDVVEGKVAESAEDADNDVVPDSSDIVGGAVHWIYKSKTMKEAKQVVSETLESYPELTEDDKGILNDAYEQRCSELREARSGNKEELFS